MSSYIGVDLGGTNLRVAKVNGDGEILEIKTAATPATGSAENVCDKIIQLANEIGLKGVKGIGIGAPGPVVGKTSLFMCTNIPSLADFDIANYIKAKTKIRKVLVDNDANCAGVAEAFVGAAKHSSSTYYITVSTGIGGVFIIDKKAVSGHLGFGGEVGSVIVDTSSTVDNGNLPAGAIEPLASGKSLVERAKAAGMDVTHAGEIFEVKDSNEIAKKLYDEFIDYMSTLIANISHIVNPQTFVIGGGVSKSWDLWIGDLKIAINKKVLKPLVGGFNIIKAELDEPGIIGAALMAI